MRAGARDATSCGNSLSGRREIFRRWHPRSGGRVPRFLRLFLRAIWEEERETERGERRDFLLSPKTPGAAALPLALHRREPLFTSPHGNPFLSTPSPLRRASRCRCRRRRRRTLEYTVACSRQWYRRKRGEHLDPLYNSRRGRRYRGEINIINNIVKKNTARSARRRRHANVTAKRFSRVLIKETRGGKSDWRRKRKREDEEGRKRGGDPQRRRLSFLGEGEVPVRSRIKPSNVPSAFPEHIISKCDSFILREFEFIFMRFFFFFFFFFSRVRYSVSRNSDLTRRRDANFLASYCVDVENNWSKYQSICKEWH